MEENEGGNKGILTVSVETVKYNEDGKN